MSSERSLFLLTAALLTGCATEPKAHVDQQFGESMIFIGEEPAALAYPPAHDQPLSVRNAYLSATGTVDYVEGRDFVVDYSSGTLRRMPGSRLPDFRKNMLFGQQNFDHSKFPGFGNNAYFAFIDYSFAPTTTWPVQTSQSQFLKSTQSKLKSGQAIKIVAFGDSITAGGDASKPELIFWRRWTDELQRKYPKSVITTVNGATGGDSTVQGLQRLQAKVLDEKPDLVLIGFGMNDHNVGSVSIPQFKQNLQEMVSRIRKDSAAEIILFSAFSPNPQWKFGSHHMAEYAAATGSVARQTDCAFADVFSNWETLAARKKPEDFLGNNINHPNDFGHWIYFRVFHELDL